MSTGTGIAIGIDLGGTVIKAGAFDSATGHLLAWEEAPTGDGEPASENLPVFARRAAQLREELERQAGGPAEVIGVSSPGLAARDGQTIRYMPGRLSGLEGLIWGDEVFGGAETFVLNDAHAALMGEIWQGSALGIENVVFLTLGTGVGGAVVADGRLLRGHRGRAGHLGHLSLDFRGQGDICGTPGSLEYLVGNYSVQQRSGGRYVSTRELVAALESGETLAREVWDESMRALAAGIASLINVVDPEVVLIGGGISQAWDTIEASLMSYLDEFEWRPGGWQVEIRKATLGERAGAYGAAYYALQQSRPVRAEKSLTGT